MVTWLALSRWIGLDQISSRLSSSSFSSSPETQGPRRSHVQKLELLRFSMKTDDSSYKTLLTRPPTEIYEHIIELDRESSSTNQNRTTSKLNYGFWRNRVSDRDSTPLQLQTNLNPS